MRAPLSIIIPTLNAQAALPGALAALMEGVGAGLVRELVVSDGGSGDATVQIARDAGALVVSGAPGRGGQLRRGAAAANGDWLLFVHADSWLVPGWGALVQGHMEAEPANAAVFRLAFRAPGLGARVVAGWANLRTRALGLPYGDQGLLIPRALYERIGGFADMPLMEDVALIRALPRRARLLDGVIETGADKYLEQGWMRRGGRNMLLLARYFLGADPIHLAHRYDRRAP
ncbi:MAG TPA: glycosyltransferase [Aliiroseovarius sp.]|nr:glycosyltransferase [Aliiroseovarius sp.]